MSDRAETFQRSSGTIFKFDANGKPLTTYSVAVEDRGTDWIELAPDQHTIYYTSEGQRILRYDTATRTQLPDFVSNLPGAAAYAMRFVPGVCGTTGQLLVADSEQIFLLDPAGKTIQTYDMPNEDTWFAININPDGKTFWSGGIDTGVAAEFDIATGTLLCTHCHGRFYRRRRRRRGNRQSRAAAAGAGGGHLLRDGRRRRRGA